MSTTIDAHDPSVRIGILAAERPKALDADTSPLRGEEKSYAITFLRGGVSTIGAKSSATNDAARRSSSTGR